MIYQYKVLYVKNLNSWVIYDKSDNTYLDNILYKTKKEAINVLFKILGVHKL